MITLGLHRKLSLIMGKHAEVFRNEGATVSATYMVGRETKIYYVEKKTKTK